MKRYEPSNETCLAVELWAACKGRLGLIRVSPYSVARVAAELCAIGRAYKRLSERLCGGSEVWGRYPEAEQRRSRAERRRAELLKQAEDILKPWGRRATVYATCGGLGLGVESKVRGRLERTVLS